MADDLKHIRDLVDTHQRNVDQMADAWATVSSSTKFGQDVERAALAKGLSPRTADRHTDASIRAMLKLKRSIADLSAWISTLQANLDELK